MTRPSAHAAISLAASIPWAIEPHWLTSILAIANREGPGPDAVAAQLGRPLDNTRSVTVRDGVAIVPVVGPIFRRASMFTEVSGATSIELLARDFAAALADPAVTAIVLDVDSPGGEANGVHELAEQLAAARGRKPLVAYVGGTGASAAYWLASAADEVVVDRTALVGSIGVVMAVPNPDAKSAAQIEIVSSQSPKKRPDMRTESGRAVVQSTVDAMAEVFVSTVARNRGVKAAEVLEKFGRGGLVVGADAVSVGMADRLGSLEGVIADLRTRAQRPGAWKARGAPAAPKAIGATSRGALDAELDAALAQEGAAIVAAARAARAAPCSARRGSDARAREVGPAPAGGDAGELTARDRERCRQFGWSEEDYAREKRAQARTE